MLYFIIMTSGEFISRTCLDRFCCNPSVHT